jgi:cell division protein FtsW (lipid II flippase)
MAASFGGTRTAGVPVRTGIRRSSYLFLIAIVAVLSVVGLVMVLSASSVASLRTFGTPWYYFERQGMYLCLGAVAFFVAQGLRISFWQRMARPLMVLAGAGEIGTRAVRGGRALAPREHP